MSPRDPTFCQALADLRSAVGVSPPAPYCPWVGAGDCSWTARRRSDRATRSQTDAASDLSGHHDGPSGQCLHSRPIDLLSRRRADRTRPLGRCGWDVRCVPCPGNRSRIPASTDGGFIKADSSSEHRDID